MAGIGYQQWHTHRHFDRPDGYGAGQFVHSSMPTQAARDTVLILAPVNCPANAERTRRSQALAQELTRRGIPNQVTLSIAFKVDRTTDVQAENARTGALMEAGPPVVFINGMAKANPSPEEVADVFQRTRSGT
jgi:hypothetical protein